MKKFRINDWKQTHLILVLTSFCLWSFYFTVPYSKFILNFLYLALTAISLASFGHYLNDFFDIKSDLLAGKSNQASNHRPSLRILIISSLLFLSLFPWVLFNIDINILFLILLEILLLFIYSFPKIRIKERPLLSILTDALYAFFIPGLVGVLLSIDGNYQQIQITKTTLFLAWLLMVGIRGIISHHIKDYQNDIRSHTTTTATKYGVDKMLLIQKIILPPIELIVFIVFLFSFYKPLGILYILYFFLILINKNVRFVLLDKRYLKAELNMVSLLLDNFYYSWLPFITIILLSYTQIEYLFLLPFLILFFYSRFVNWILNLYDLLYEWIYEWIYRAIIFRTGSFIVNYSLYYSFLVFGINLKEKAKEREEREQRTSQKNEILKADFSNQSEARPILSEVIEKNVHGLWIGKKLSNMELLTIHSFIAHGYTFHLWTYNTLENQLPDGTILCDANEIISEDKIFTYKNASQFGNGLGSVAGFSDIFRYKLLYEKGGWWVDMDITCLTPFDISGDYFFRAHNSLDVVGNIIKAPVKSELMLICYEQAIASIDENNIDWHKPIQILCDAINQLNLKEYIYGGLSNTDEFYKFEKYYFSDVIIPQEWKFIHWNNEILRTYGLHKDYSFYNSVYSQLLRKYNLMEETAVHSLINKKFKRQLLIANLKKIL